jgi:transposase InsO family protein
MSTENQLWGAPRIHGELLKLGFSVAQSTVAKYMVKRRGPPSQGWRTFLRNHATDIAAMDLFVVPTIGFKLLYGFVIVRIDRRDLVWINVTTNPTAEWIAHQITEAFPWDGAPGYMIRDRDRIYGAVVTRRLRAMGIRDKPIAPASPWQNGFAERLIGSIRRECLDHIIVSGEAHLRRILISYAAYYNSVRTHRSLQKDADFSSDSTDRDHSFTPDPWRASPSLRPGLSFRYTHDKFASRTPCQRHDAGGTGRSGGPEFRLSWFD